MILELDDRIARLEVRVKQLGVHLKSLGRTGGEAERVRSLKYRMLQELKVLKQERARVEALTATTSTPVRRSLNGIGTR